MDDTTLVGKCHIGSDKDIVGNGLTENFNTEDIGNNFFGFALKIWMDKGDMVV